MPIDSVTFLVYNTKEKRCYMDLLTEIKEARRQINLQSAARIDYDSLGYKYYLTIKETPKFFLEALSQIAKEKNTRVYAYVKTEKKTYEFTPAKNKKEVYIVAGDKYYTMTEDYFLIENNTPASIKNAYNNTPSHWFDVEK